MTDPNGQEVKYTYDTLRRTVGVETTVGTGDDAVAYRNRYTYDGDKLTQVSHNTTGDECDVSYNFEYDEKNRRTAVKVGNQVLSRSIYNDTPGDPLQGTLTKSVFGNGGEIRNTYDAFKRVVGMQYDNDSMDRYQYQYGANGQVVRLIDTHLHRTALSEYDLANRPMRITHMEGDTHLYTGQVGYDDQGNLQTFKEWAGQGRAPYRTDFAYDIENKPTVIGYGLTAQERDNTKITYSYDGLGRTAARTLKLNGTNYAANYTYLPGGHGEGSTTSLISAITQGSGDNAENFQYTYDDVGNITSVTQNGKLTSYEYDPLGQLIRVNDQNDLTSGENGTTWTYAYDRGGNILNKKRYAYTVDTLPETALETVTYAYTDDNWKDKLTEFNGSYITYDEIGNPTSDGEWLYAWEKGRQLKAMSKASETVVFEYNASGLRVKKIATSTGTTNYTLHGKQITHLTNGSNALHFFYDAAGKPTIVEWNNGATTQKFAYIHNLQGDIIALIDSTGAKVVSYTYDAWGKPLSTTGSLAATLGKLNPFRYRGYVFDEETELYYISSRYYDPEIGRWINEDGYVSTGQGVMGNNMFAYCGNNPVNRVDPTGQVWSEIWEFAQTAVTATGKTMGLMSPAYAGCAGVAAVDGPLLFGDIVGAAGAALLTVGAIGYGIYQAAQAPAISIPKAEEKAEVIPASPPTPTIIYRYYSSKTENLSPRPGIDNDGLSFSTNPPRLGVSAVVTTIEQVNATGILTAIPTGGAHVIVIPTNGTVNQWMSQGMSSIWSQTLSLIVVEWDGGY